MDQSNYTLPGIMHYLQNQYTIIEKNKILNELEKSELKLKITKLESEKNSLLIENDKLRGRIKRLESQTGVKQNGNSTQDLEEQLTTIDTTNLVKAKQFLKNTTNEILYLLNSPSLDKSDPLGLSKEESEFVLRKEKDDGDEFDQSANDTNGIHNNTDDKDIFGIENGNQNIFQQENGNSDSFAKLTISASQNDQLGPDSDAETINGEPQPTHGDGVEENTAKEIGHLNAKSPFDFFQVDMARGIIYAHGKKSDHISVLNIDSGDSHKYSHSTLPLYQPSTKTQASRKRKFFINPLSFESIESFRDSLYVSSETTGSEKLHAFDSDVIDMDFTILNSDTILIAVVLAGDFSPQFFELGRQNVLKPHEHHTLTEVPSDFQPMILKFNNQREITMLSQDGKAIRYDHSEDSIVSRNKINVNLINNCQYHLSADLFIHELNSTTLTVLNLNTEELITCVIDQPFQITSISTFKDHFTLNYSNGVVELYDAGLLFEYHYHSTSNSDQGLISTGELPDCIKRFDYYQQATGKAFIIKDIAVDIAETNDIMKLYIVGSDSIIKEYAVQ